MTLRWKKSPGEECYTARNHTGHSECSPYILLTVTLISDEFGCRWLWQAGVWFPRDPKRDNRAYWYGLVAGHTETRPIPQVEDSCEAEPTVWRIQDDRGKAQMKAREAMNEAIQRGVIAQVLREWNAEARAWA